MLGGRARGRVYNYSRRDERDDKNKSNYLISCYTPGNDNRISIDFESPATVPKFIYNIIDRRNQVIQRGTMPKGGASLHANLNLLPDRYIDYDFILRYGVSTNPNSTLLTENDAKLWGGEYRIYGINKTDYDVSFNFLDQNLRINQFQHQLWKINYSAQIFSPASAHINSHLHLSI
jgi:hypothetical protein